MNKEIVVTRDDFKAFLQYALTRLPFSPKDMCVGIITQALMWLVVLLTLFIIFLPSNIILAGLHWPTALMVSAFFVVVIIMFLVFYARLQDKCYPTKDGLILGSRLIEVTASGVKDSNQYGTTSYGWGIVEEVVSHNGNVYFMLDNMLGQIIPSSAFSSDDERESYVIYIKSLHTGVDKEGTAK